MITTGGTAPTGTYAGGDKSSGHGLCTLSVTPLGAGCEVGRSCVIVSYQGVNIMFDCGIHPGYEGISSLPLLDHVKLSSIDVCFVTHFHLDHCGALPYLVGSTDFKGRIFMTTPTQAICFLLWQDYLRLVGAAGGRSRGKISADKTAPKLRNALYTREMVEKTMEKIEIIELNETLRIPELGLKVLTLSAGHVIGACQFLVEIRGRRILYTGDFSAENDRHVPMAAIPPVRPDVLICESTFGTRVHDCRQERENHFLNSITNAVIGRKGKVLLPVFAIGRAQELLLILEEHWRRNATAFKSIPIFYISHLAMKAMPAYRSALDHAGNYVRGAAECGRNAYKFQFINVVESLDEVKSVIDDRSMPCVVLCSPGMLQNGASRTLFEQFAPHHANSIILTGYSVKGTLADTLRRSPNKVQMGDQTLIVRASVDIFSFCAHSDYLQTREFINQLDVQNIILVHGERSEGLRLKAKLMEDLNKPDYPLKITNPDLCETVNFAFPPSQTALLLGDVARSVLEAKKISLEKNILGKEQIEGEENNRSSLITELNNNIFAIDDSTSAELLLVGDDLVDSTIDAVKSSTIEKTTNLSSPATDDLTSLDKIITAEGATIEEEVITLPYDFPVEVIHESLESILGNIELVNDNKNNDTLKLSRFVKILIERRGEEDWISKSNPLKDEILLKIRFTSEPLDILLVRTATILIEGLKKDHLLEKLSPIKEPKRKLPDKHISMNEEIKIYLKDKFGVLENVMIADRKYLRFYIPRREEEKSEVLVSIDDREVKCDDENVRQKVLGALENYSILKERVTRL